MLLASDYDKSKYLKADRSRAREEVSHQERDAEELGVGKDKETKLVVWFTNDARGLVLNKTNNRTLRGAFGDDTAGWVNKVIAVFPTMVDIRGKMGPALRVRIPPPKQAAAAAPPTQPHHRHRPAMALRQQHHHRRHRLLIRSSSRIRSSR